jgi:hypothetical protein
LEIVHGDEDVDFGPPYISHITLNHLSLVFNGDLGRKRSRKVFDERTDVNDEEFSVPP